MRPSLLLWLRMALAGLRPAGVAAQSAAALPRPDGALIWLHLSETAAGGAALLARRLARQRPGLQIRVTMPAAQRSTVEFPAGVALCDAPEDTPKAARRLLQAWHPDLIVLLGNDLPASLISAAADQGVGLVMADARILPGAPRRGWLMRRLQGALLARLSRILVGDPVSAAALVRLGADPNRTEIGGILSEPPDPLPCSESERASIAAQMRARPVWFAAAVPEAELDAVLAAQSHALQLAHRMLLILAPDAPGDALALCARLDAEGWAVGRRSLEGEPDEHMQIFVADDPADYGLWYRLAPVTYFGGTLSDASRHSRSPLEAAALGSAIVHGPQTAPFASEYARLTEARAARFIGQPAALAEAVADLTAPDRVAVLAHNAWAVTSGGAGAAETVARAILTELDARRAGGAV